MTCRSTICATSFLGALVFISLILSLPERNGLGGIFLIISIIILCIDLVIFCIEPDVLQELCPKNEIMPEQVAPESEDTIND